MRTLTVFNSISLDGYFTDAKSDMSWAHADDAEWIEFTQENASGGGEMLFGRVTYEMMAGWWPSPAALKQFPVVAKQMNELPKVVFSKTMKKAEWQNTRLIKGDLTEEVRKLKKEKGLGLLIFGSGQIVAQLTQARLIDEYQLVVNPLVLGAGRTMFEGVKDRLKLKRKNARTFKNGNVVLYYERAE